MTGFTGKSTGKGRKRVQICTFGHCWVDEFPRKYKQTIFNNITSSVDNMCFVLLNLCNMGAFFAQASGFYEQQKIPQIPYKSKT